MIDLGKEHKPCKYGHDSPRTSQGRCMECKRIRELNDYMSGRYKKSKANKIRRSIIKAAGEIGINGDIRREIENRRLDKELEDLLNV